MSVSRSVDGPTRIRNAYGRFAKIPEAIVKDRSLSDRAVRVYALLWIYSDKNTRDAWPTRAAMADDLGVSKSTIDRGLAELVDRGALSIEYAYDGARQTSNTYTILVVQPAAEVVHRGRRSAAPPSSTRAADLKPPRAANLNTPGAANLNSQEQEPKEQGLKDPVPYATHDAAAPPDGRTGPATPATLVSTTHGHPLSAADVFAAVGEHLPATFDDDALEQLAGEIIARSSTRVLDPTGYVIRALRNPDGRVEWINRALDIDVARHRARAGAGGF